MKPEEQQIAIAKACGWEFCERPRGRREYLIPHCRHPVKTVGGIHRKPLWKTLGHLPFYPNNLNAMHEAEKTLTPDQREDYGHALSQIVPQSINHGPLDPTEPEAGDVMCWSLFDLANATAEQRAECFLKTLNLWTDSP